MAGRRRRSQTEIVEPVENVDEQKHQREKRASVAVDVVWIFHSEDSGCSASGFLHRRQAALVVRNFLLGPLGGVGLFPYRLLRGLLSGGADFHRLVWLSRPDDGEGGVPVGFIELPLDLLPQRRHRH